MAERHFESSEEELAEAGGMQPGFHVTIGGDTIDYIVERLFKAVDGQTYVSLRPAGKLEEDVTTVPIDSVVKKEA